jgi:predicted alpha/beta-hydrolase family hydrolase
MSQVGGRTREIATGGGVAQVELDGVAKRARFLFVLTHGAGGGVGSPDLLAVRDAAVELGGLVARVLQPYRVRGASAPGSPVRQDEAWLEIVAALRKLAPKTTPLVQGGRSNGARVACRTATAVGARAVVALAFPLHPPGRPERTRADELRAPRGAGIPVLVINGERDPFGIPAKKDANRLVVVPGETHALKGHTTVVKSALSEWLPAVLSG